MDQSDRIAEFERFKRDEINILIASDVAARGLDVKGVSHVINFDVPWQPDDYIHRIGRTGRAGATGTAITLATREDNEAVGAIEKLTGTKISRAETSEPQTAPVEAKRPEKRAERPKRSERPTRKDREEFREPSPVVEDIQPDWNGPLPSFLSVGAL
jgi:superfamily II DNA/RNA helicase